MIERLSIGVDIVELERFIEIPFFANSRFYKKIFLPSEIKYCLRYRNSVPHFAGKFALKEAVKKAIDDNLGMLQIETCHHKSKPTVKLVSVLREKYLLKASLSHGKNYAIAVVIAEKVC